jgi:transcription elongation factor Elf1
MRQVHGKGKKKLNCEYCGKVFVHPTKLKEHVAVIHTREYPWACRVCGRQYRAAANWRMHEKKSHPEEYAKLLKPNYLKSNEEILAEQSQQFDVVEYNMDKMQ